MEWFHFLIGFISGLIMLMLLKVPLAMAFFSVNFVFIALVFGFESGSEQMILNIYDTLNRFILAPIPLFILMGELMFHSRLAARALEVVSMLLGKIPGRLSLIAVSGGTVFSVLSGAAIATTAMLGSTLVPEMRERGYSKAMSLGPVVASGGLAMVIPPSGVAVLLASVGQISVGKVLIAGFLPGILMATLYFGYIVLRCWLNPTLAPPYDVELPSFSERLQMVLRDLLPLGFIVFLVLGLIFIGVATPTEAAGLGVAGTGILAAAYRSLSWEVLRKSIFGTIAISGMILFIMAGAVTFSQLLAFTGASRGLVEAMLALPVEPWMILIFMQLSLLILGTIMDATSMIMLAVPVFMPLVISLGFDPIWFAILTLINLQIGNSTPPIGLLLFVMKGVAPPDVTMADIYKSAFPFVLCDLTAMASIMVFPGIALWLPSLGI